MKILKIKKHNCNPYCGGPHPNTPEWRNNSDEIIEMEDEEL